MLHSFFSWLSLITSSKRAQKQAETMGAQGTDVPLEFIGTKSGKAESSISSIMSRFIYDNSASRIDSHPKGWARLASQQRILHNRNLHRVYRELTQRVILYEQRKLGATEKDILNRDRVQAEGDKTAGQDNKVHETPVQPSSSKTGGAEEYVHDYLLERAGDELQRYANLLHYFQESGEAWNASPSQHKALYDLAINDNELSEEECEFMLMADDYVVPHTDPTENIVEWLSQGWPHSLFVWAFKDRSSICCKGDEESVNSDDEMPTISRNKLQVVSNYLLVFVSEMLLLTPVMLLYLGNLSKVVSAVIVVTFGTFFSICISMTSGWSFRDALISLSAYIAVLATFLAQLQTDGPGNGSGNGSMF